MVDDELLELLALDALPLAAAELAIGVALLLVSACPAVNE
jgi:NADH:ubiquinone oxidoreductase subunit K